MKKLIAIAACTMPMVFASTLYAQDKAADTMKTDPAAASTSGTTHSAKSGASASDVPSTGQGTAGSTGEGAAGATAAPAPAASAPAASAPAASTPAASAPAAPAPDPSSDKTPPYTAPEPMPSASAPAAASTAPMKTEKTDMDKQAISGISVKKSIMGKAVYNEADEKIGDISDVVLASDGQAAYFIVGAGGFLGMGEHNVAIPYEKLQQNGDKMVLPGFSKDQLKALPKVEIKG